MRASIAAAGAARRRIEGDPRNPLDLGDRVFAGVVSAVAAAPAISEVDAAGQLAHDQQVGALDPFGAQWTRLDESGARAHRAKVRVKGQALPEPEQPLLGPRGVRVGRVPARTTHGAEQDGVRLTAGVQHPFGEGFPVGVDRSAADQVLGELEAAELIQDAPRRADDLGPDPVAGQQDDPFRGHERCAEMLRRT